MIGIDGFDGRLGAFEGQLVGFSMDDRTRTFDVEVGDELLLFLIAVFPIEWIHGLCRGQHRPAQAGMRLVQLRPKLNLLKSGESSHVPRVLYSCRKYRSTKAFTFSLQQSCPKTSSWSLVAAVSSADILFNSSSTAVTSSPYLISFSATMTSHFIRATLVSRSM